MPLYATFPNLKFNLSIIPVSSRDFPIGNVFNKIILIHGPKNITPLKTMNEDQITTMSGYGSHVLPIAFEVTHCLNATGIHRT